jgi:hypothetical protein
MSFVRRLAIMYRNALDSSKDETLVYDLEQPDGISAFEGTAIRVGPLKNDKTLTIYVSGKPHIRPSEHTQQRYISVRKGAVLLNVIHTPHDPNHRNQITCTITQPTESQRGFFCDASKAMLAPAALTDVEPLNARAFSELVPLKPVVFDQWKDEVGQRYKTVMSKARGCR